MINFFKKHFTNAPVCEACGTTESVDVIDDHEMLLCTECDTLFNYKHRTIIDGDYRIVKLLTFMMGQEFPLAVVQDLDGLLHVVDVSTVMLRKELML